MPGAENDLFEEKIARLDEQEPDFSLEEKTAIEFADKMALDHKSLDDDFFQKLHICFSDEQILELGMMIGQFIGFGRLLRAVDLEPKFCET